MDVAIEPHRGVTLSTKQEIDLGQYRIRVDGKTVGFLGYADGSKICLTRRYSPIEIEEIEKKVSDLAKQEGLKSTQPPEMPEGLEKEDELDEDDLN